MANLVPYRSPDFEGTLSASSMKRTGQGTYLHHQHGIKYSGEYLEGRKHGKGNLVVHGYSEYEGDFWRGEISGYGKKVWANGITYSGQFKDGEMHGIGEWSNNNILEVYSGDFVHNKRQGQGKLSTRTFRYSGEFLNHRFHGKGELVTLETGAVYSGDFVNGVATGIGRLITGNFIFEGQFVAGEPSGIGEGYCRQSGYSIKGDWISGRPLISSSSMNITAPGAKPLVEAIKKKSVNLGNFSPPENPEKIQVVTVPLASPVLEGLQIEIRQEANALTKNLPPEPQLAHNDYGRVIQMRIRSVSSKEESSLILTGHVVFNGDLTLTTDNSDKQPSVSQSRTPELLYVQTRRFVISAGVAKVGNFWLPKDILKGIYFAEFTDVTETDVSAFVRMTTGWICINVA